MRVLVVLLLAAAAGAAPADDYFELGLDYLKKGFFRRARAAFSECLVRAPGQPVPTVFAGIAAAAEGLPPATCARLLRTGMARLPAGKTLRVDLRRRLPSRRALALLERDYDRHLARAGETGRRDALTVLAFLQVQDGEPADAAALDRLLAADPKDPFARALAALRPIPAAAGA